MVTLFEMIGSETAQTLNAMVDPRKKTSGGPRDRSRHLSYQRAYEKNRKRFGVNVKRTDGTHADGWIETWTYGTRRDADRVRRAIAAGVFPGFALRVRVKVAA